MVREESSTLFGVEGVGGGWVAQHVMRAIASAHEARRLVFTGVQQHVSELVTQAPANQFGDEQVGQALWSRARADAVDQRPGAAHAQEHHPPRPPFHERHPCERRLGGRVFEPRFHIRLHDDQAVAGFVLPPLSDDDTVRLPDGVRLGEDGGLLLDADRKRVRHLETDGQGLLPMGGDATAPAAPTVSVTPVRTVAANGPCIALSRADR